MTPEEKRSGTITYLTLLVAGVLAVAVGFAIGYLIG